MVEILVYYDEPQLVLLRSDRDRDVIAIAVRKSGMEQPFFGCEVHPRTFERYFDNKADLHFVFTQAWGSAYYLFDLAESSEGKVDLYPASQQEVMDETYWPSVGFFARSHTSPYQLKTFEHSVLQEFKIDGNWDAYDFSQFHGKMSDLYALFSALAKLKITGSQEQAHLRDSIQERFWRGGGSYVGFYDDLSSRLRSVGALQIARIKYASPGEIAVRGNAAILSDLNAVIEIFETKADTLREAYKIVYSVLRKEKLLSADTRAKFSSKAIESFVYRNTVVLSDSLNLNRTEELFSASGDNVLVFSKIVLSIYRRAHELHNFFAEGRVQDPLRRT